MGILGLIKDAIGCQVSLAHLHSQSDIEFYKLTGINPVSLHKDVKNALKQTCTDQWKMNDTVQYPIEVVDFTLIKLGIMCNLSKKYNDNERLEVFGDALYKLSKDMIGKKYNLNIYSFVENIAGMPMYF